MLSLDKPTRTLQADRDNPVFVPPFLGVKQTQMVLLDEIIGYIDRRSLFRDHWHLVPNPGETDASFAVRALDLLQERMQALRSQDLLEPKAAYGFFPVNSSGDQLVVWEDESRCKERLRLPFPRSSDNEKPCIPDLFKPVGEADYVAFQVTTLGNRLSNETPHLYPGGIRERYVALLALARAVLDAFDEYWHRRIRYEWGFGFEDGPSLVLLFGHHYRGERYRLSGSASVAPEILTGVTELLETHRVGVTIDGLGLRPALSSAALVAHHPRAMAFDQG